MELNRFTPPVDDGQWGALLCAAQSGDTKSYRDFLVAILPFTRAIARRRCHAGVAVEDVVQDVLLTIHRVRHTYEPGRPVKPWLATIIFRRALDANRMRGKVNRREVHNPQILETFADAEANKHEDMISSDSLAHLMEDLTPKQKEAVELVKLREMTLVEASAASGQTVASLKVNIHRAIKHMRQRLTGMKES